jgi:hypothetical protein
MTYTPAFVDRRASPSFFVTPYSREGTAFTNVAPVSGVMSITNTSGQVYPIVLAEACIAYRLFWLNGATVGTDTMQVGIYDAAGNAVVRGTATTTAGANVCQFDDIADTSLPPGRYYLAMRISGGTATLFRSPGVVINRISTPAWLVTASSGLPTDLSTLSVQSPGNAVQVPVFGFVARSFAP